MIRKKEAEERQALIQLTQIAGKFILWRVARMAFHSIESKAISISILQIIFGGREVSVSKLWAISWAAMMLSAAPRPGRNHFAQDQLGWE